MSIFSQVFGGEFDSSTVEPQQEFDLLPTNKYGVLIEKSEIKPTKKNDGHYLEVCCTVTDDSFKGRKLWSRMNIDNPSELAQKIGLSQLSSLCRACGVNILQDESQLCGKTCIADVKIKNEQNEIRNWLPYGDSNPKPAQKTSPKPLQQESAKPTGNKPPWQR